MQSLHWRNLFCLLIAAVMATGCVVVPYRPSADVAMATDIALDPADLIVTAGPRKLLQDIGKRLTRHDPAVTVVGPAAFADVAFLDEDVRLARLLAPDACSRVREQLGVQYVVLLGEVEEQTLEERGFMAVYMGFFGLAQSKERTALAATIIDLEARRPLSNVRSDAEGSSTGVGLFYGLFIVPMTESSAKAGLVRGVVASMRQDAGKGPLKIAVMAAERAPAAEVSPPPSPGESGQ
jgi:hypothetical protein